MKLILYVKTQTGETIKIKGLEPDTTIAELKKQIGLKMDANPDDLLTDFAGKRLDDNHSLQDYYIQNESTINLTSRVERHSITLLTPSMEYRFEHEIDYEETVKGFKAKVTKFTGCPNPKIYLDGKLAEDNVNFTKLMRENKQLKLSIEVEQEPNMNLAEMRSRIVSIKPRKRSLDAGSVEEGAEQKGNSSIWPYMVAGGIIGAAASGVTMATVLGSTSLASSTVPLGVLCTISIAASVLIGMATGAGLHQARSR